MQSLYTRAEQTPNPDNRVTLGTRRDALGTPHGHLEWRLTDRETASVTTWLSALDAELRRHGLGRVIPPRTNWRKRIVGAPITSAPARMGDDPRTSVVDRNCRVHSVENLSVSGSSVFATGGHANPTFMLVALALRLNAPPRATAIRLTSVTGTARPSGSTGLASSVRRHPFLVLLATLLLLATRRFVASQASGVRAAPARSRSGPSEVGGVRRTDPRPVWLTGALDSAPAPPLAGLRQP
jgi:hypothetical protein